MAENPYSTLGIGKEASDAEIKSAYRTLAKKLHPDLNPGDKNAESQFKTVSAAYELLSDVDKRARFDRGEIDEDGQPKQPERAWYRPHAEGADGARYASSAGYDDFSDLFSDIFARQQGGAGGGARRANMQFPGDDVRYTLTIDFLEAAAGTKKRLTMPDGKVLDLSIPEGIEDGQVLRLKGQGGPGYNGGPAGDALVEIHIAPHAFFARHDKDVTIELPVTLAEAVLGGKIEVPTVHGPVSMTVPKGSNAGTVLRLRGRGIKRGSSAGDQLITLTIVLPEQADEDLERLVADWASTHPQPDPRAKMRSVS